MSLTLQRLCLALVLLTAAWGSSPAGAAGGPGDGPEPPPAPLGTRLAPADLPEPPPAPLVEPDQPEPPPAPLEGAAQSADAASAKPRPASRGRASRATAWTGVAITLALLTTGTVVGVLAQQRSDSLSRSTTQLIDGLAPIYDASQHAAYTDLQTQGQTYNNVAIGCFFAGGATALVSAILFWNAGRLQARDKTLALRSCAFSERRHRHTDGKILMRARLFAVAGTLVALTAGLLLSQCYNPTYSDCAFRCGTAAPMCPPQYACRSDGYCHLPDSAAVCAAGRDLGVGIDLSPDAASSADAGTD